MRFYSLPPGSRSSASLLLQFSLSCVPTRSKASTYSTINNLFNCLRSKIDLKKFTEQNPEMSMSESSDDILWAFDRQTAFNQTLIQRLNNTRVEKDFIRQEYQTRIDELEAELHRLSTSVHKHNNGNSSNTNNGGKLSQDDSSSDLQGLLLANTADDSASQDASSRGTSPRRSGRLGLSPRSDHKKCNAVIARLTSERDTLASRLQMHARQLMTVQRKFEMVEKNQELRLDKDLDIIDAQTAQLRISVQKHVDVSAAISTQPSVEMVTLIKTLRNDLELARKAKKLESERCIKQVSQIERVYAELESERLTVRDLQRRCFEQEGRHADELDEVNASYSIQIQELKAAVNAKSEVLDRCELETSNVQLQQQVKSLTNELSTAHRALEEAQERLTKNDPATSLTNVRQHHAREIQRLKDHSSLLQRALSSAEEDIKLLRATAAPKTPIVPSESQDSKKLQRELAQMREEVAALASALDEQGIVADNAESETKATIKGLRHQLKDMEKKALTVPRLTKALEDAEQRAEIAEQARTRTQAVVLQAGHEIQVSRDKLENAQKEVSGMRVELDDAKAAFTAELAAGDKAQEKLKKVQNELELCSKVQDDLMIAVRKAENQKDIISAELSSLKLKNTSLEQQHGAVEEECGRLRIRVKKMEADVADTERKIQHTQEDLAKQQQQRQQMEIALKASSEMNALLEEQIEDLQEEYDTAHAAHHSATADYDERHKASERILEAERASRKELEEVLKQLRVDLKTEAERSYSLSGQHDDARELHSILLSDHEALKLIHEEEVAALSAAVAASKESADMALVEVRSSHSEEVSTLHVSWDERLREAAALHAEEIQKIHDDHKEEISNVHAEKCNHQAKHDDLHQEHLKAKEEHSHAVRRLQAEAEARHESLEAKHAELHSSHSDALNAHVNAITRIKDEASERLESFRKEVGIRHASEMHNLQKDINAALTKAAESDEKFKQIQNDHMVTQDTLQLVQEQLKEQVTLLTTSKACEVTLSKEVSDLIAAAELSSKATKNEVEQIRRGYESDLAKRDTERARLEAAHSAALEAVRDERATAERLAAEKLATTQDLLENSENALRDVREDLQRKSTSVQEIDAAQQELKTEKFALEESLQLSQAACTDWEAYCNNAAATNEAAYSALQEENASQAQQWADSQASWEAWNADTTAAHNIAIEELHKRIEDLEANMQSKHAVEDYDTKLNALITEHTKEVTLITDKAAAENAELLEKLVSSKELSNTNQVLLDSEKLKNMELVKKYNQLEEQLEEATLVSQSAEHTTRELHALTQELQHSKTSYAALEEDLKNAEERHKKALEDAKDVLIEKAQREHGELDAKYRAEHTTMETSMDKVKSQIAELKAEAHKARSEHKQISKKHREALAAHSEELKRLETASSEDLQVLQDSHKQINAKLDICHEEHAVELEIERLKHTQVLMEQKQQLTANHADEIRRLENEISSQASDAKSAMEQRMIEINDELAKAHAAYAAKEADYQKREADLRSMHRTELDDLRVELERLREAEAAQDEVLSKTKLREQELENTLQTQEHHIRVLSRRRSSVADVKEALDPALPPATGSVASGISYKSYASKQSSLGGLRLNQSQDDLELENSAFVGDLNSSLEGDSDEDTADETED